VTALALEDVQAGYGKTAVLDGVSFSVGARETVVMLGPNGSGKSTVAKTVMGLTTFYSGAIAWRGDDLTRLPSWRRTRSGLGYVPQVANVFPSLTVEENLLVGGNYLASRGRHERLAELYELMPLIAKRRRVSAGNLSGGERRLLALAATLVVRPQLLVLDEPTSDLSPTAIELVFENLREVRRRLEVPLLVIEQNVDRALELADRVCVLLRGRVAVDRPVGAIDQQELGRIFLERPPDQVGPPVAAELPEPPR
jgi:ABC-type branched-subunit amino acid transport system ATPase component